MTLTLHDEKTQQILVEVQARIKAAYPEATCTVAVGADPVGLYVDASTDAPDGFAALDLVSNWLVDLHVNEGLAMHVIPLPTPKPGAGSRDPGGRGETAAGCHAPGGAEVARYGWRW
jgi:hypothetical protein